MEMMESIAIIDLAVEKTDPCWYCKKDKEDDNVENEEDESPPSPVSNNEDNVEENYETNDASKLGTNLRNKPAWKMTHKIDDEDPINQGDESTIVPSAHHLIPGNASMKKAKQLHRYMLWKDNNDLDLRGPIGYNINSKQNGVWLPGNYAVRAGTAFGQTWSAFKDKFKNKYAKVAMKKAQHKQLHDAHKPYNDNVLDTLIEIAKKLDGFWKKRENCPMCGTKFEDKARPPYGLIGRLNIVSQEHKIPLLFPKSNKKAINNDYYTSSRVKNVYG